jgi:hypothetical protein
MRALDHSTVGLLDSPDTAQQANVAANLLWWPQDSTNLEFGSPHAPDGFVWGSPPVDDSDLSIYQTQNNFSPVGSVTMGVKVAGPAVTLGTFPIAQRVASTLFQCNSGLLSVDIAAAIRNDSDDGEVGVFVAKDTGPTISVGSSSDVYDGIIAPLGHFCKRSGVSFSLDIAPLVKQNTSVALYVVMYGANQATSYITVTATLKYANLDG